MDGYDCNSRCFVRIKREEWGFAQHPSYISSRKENNGQPSVVYNNRCMRYDKVLPVEMQKMIKILEALKWTAFCQKRGP
jgi:hypothetical protein